MIKRIFKTLGVLTFFGISLVSLYLVNLFYMKPASIDHYLAKEVITDLVDSPEAMTYMGVFDDLNWLTNHNAKLSIPKSDDLKKDIQNARKIQKPVPAETSLTAPLSEDPSSKSPSEARPSGSQ